MVTNQQQNELDKIEQQLLIVFFGSDKIPESTSIALKLMNVNPNEYIRKFENIMIPIMKDNGLIDGKILKKIIQLSKYKEIGNMFSIPDGDFYLSEISTNIIKTFLPGLLNYDEL